MIGHNFMDSILITSRDTALMKLVFNFYTLFPDLQVRPYEVIANEEQYADIFYSRCIHLLFSL